jgi:hypothetical protein
MTTRGDLLCWSMKLFDIECRAKLSFAQRRKDAKQNGRVKTEMNWENPLRRDHNDWTV